MAGEAGPRGAQPSPSAPPSPPEPDGDGPYKTGVEGTADAEVLAVGGRAASVASGGADAEERTGHGHVNLADVDGITPTTAEGVEAQLDAETLCRGGRAPRPSHNYRDAARRKDREVGEDAPE
ncbi:hypothetical protein EMIHUDRAFT_244677 [Emiliania huxleyi CCMP1516]|uniref:Uncharacterized protein n=2 Tax=Emiliania huxleyi TaxID=2903 RepID=A0A0D3J092_EMIH1|nr:hypothetical protein EMIHUDRAFT_244677 [Emiliania huxleyi CCMP1516]EOD16927.1 hypothetical protein EMIHUDRAFT_244677 [Emiliania huxleyi CCMP1516]|eukprot:XP_005769356.1 hypothetical protein EMIHUDRAFT_244677 [Emiliania huxleyi CCMP1516]